LLGRLLVPEDEDKARAAATCNMHVLAATLRGCAW
jgi:hypothetical protein